MRIDVAEYITECRRISQYCQDRQTEITELKSALATFRSEMEEHFVGKTGTAIVSYLDEAIKSALEKTETLLTDEIETMNMMINDMLEYFEEDGIVDLDYINDEYLYHFNRFSDAVSENLEETNRITRSIDDIIDLPRLNVDFPQELKHAMRRTVDNVTNLVTDLDRHWQSMLDRIDEQIEELKTLLSRIDDNNISPMTYQAGTIQFLSGEIAALDVSDMTDEEFIRHMFEQFGFDEEAAKLMLKLKERIAEKFPDMTQQEKDWLFNRLLGGLVYGADGEGFFEDFKNFMMWNSTSGNLGFLFTTDGIPGQGDRPMTLSEIYKELGFTDDEYKLLRYKIRIQNQISSSPEALKYDSLGPEYTAIFKARLEEVLGRAMTDEEFELYWKAQWEAMHDKGDYAHLAIIIATHLADNSISLAAIYSQGKEELEYNASWFGDLTTVNKETGLASAGPDDYIADLDAANIIYLMKKYNLSYEQALAKYYEALSNGDYTRAELFVEHTSYEFVLQKVLAEYGVSSVEDLKITQPDVYNFLLSLKNGENEMRQY